MAGAYLNGGPYITQFYGYGFHSSTILVRKCLQGKNALAYFVVKAMTLKKRFVALASVVLLANNNSSDGDDK